MKPGVGRVEVAVAAVVDHCSRTVLLAQRAADAHQGGLWEFPGGKVEPSETVDTALTRELLEELGITVTESEPLLKVFHDYIDKRVLLDVWLVTAFVGKPLGRQGQPLQWVAVEQLHQIALPAANAAIVKALQQHFAVF